MSERTGLQIWFQFKETKNRKKSTKITRMILVQYMTRKRGEKREGDKKKTKREGKKKGIYRPKNGFLGVAAGAITLGKVRWEERD